MFIRYTDLEPAMQIIHPPCVVSTDKVFWRTQLLLFFPAPVYSVDICTILEMALPFHGLAFGFVFTSKLEFLYYSAKQSTERDCWMRFGSGFFYGNQFLPGT